MSNPALPVLEANAIKAPVGASVIELRSLIRFLQSEDAVAFVAGLVAQNALQTYGLSAASQAEMEAGTEAALRAVSPLRIRQAIAAVAATQDIRLTVANQAARYALTLTQVQQGDYVYQTDTSTLYEVTDQTALDGAGGYTALATLPWSAITGKPTTISGYGITDAADKSWKLKSAAYTALAGDKIEADTSSIGAFTINLPMTPAIGDSVEIVDAFSSWPTFALTIGRNGSKIEGVSANLVCDISRRTLLTYTNVGTGWKVN